MRTVTPFSKKSSLLAAFGSDYAAMEVLHIWLAISRPRRSLFAQSVPVIWSEVIT